MRFITQFSDERTAYAFCAFLENEGISASFESGVGKNTPISIWVIDEDDWAKATDVLERFRKLSDSEQAEYAIPKLASSIHRQDISDRGPRSHNPRVPRSTRYLRGPCWLTYLLINLCVFLFLWNSAQYTHMPRRDGKRSTVLMLTPLQRALFFDDVDCSRQTENVDALPQAQQAIEQLNTCLYWHGVYELMTNRIHHIPSPWAHAPLFQNIRQGEVWRLITPSLLHSDFLHILFNMTWLWALGRQIEPRLGRGKMLLLILVTGVLSNLMQYLVSGPFFLGFSGVVVGMVGFIWIRQRRAPWEGYPLTRATALFVMIFVLAMFGLEFVSTGLALLGVHGLITSMANTAHIVGGLTGMGLALLPFFSRSAP